MDNTEKKDKELCQEELDNVSGGCGGDDEDESSYGTDYIDENGFLMYIIKKGDTLKSIADRYGINGHQLSEANPQIANVNILKPGWKILVKKM